MPKAKTVIVVLPSVGSARDALLTGTIESLRREADVVVLSPLWEEKAFVEELNARDIKVAPLPPPPDAGLRGYLRRKCYGMRKQAGLSRIAHHGSVQTLLIEQEGLRKKNPFKYYKKYLVWQLIGRRPLVSDLLQRVSDLLSHDVYYEHVLKSYRPSLIIFYDIFNSRLESLIAATRRARVPSVGVLQSWDNLSAKGVLSLRYNKLVVWNRMMRDEVLKYYDGYSPGDVCVAGGIMFDYYFDHRKFGRREDFLKELEGQTGKKIITFMLGYPDMFPGWLDHVDMLCQAVKNGRFVSPVQLVIRTQPGPRSAGLSASLKKYEGEIVLDDPNESFLNETESWRAFKENLFWYGKLVKHSDIIVNYISTTSVDAAVFDKPNVSIAFDGYTQRPYHESISRYLDRTHYQWLKGCNGNKIARGEDDLIEHINTYLSEPDRDCVGRQVIIQRVAERVDGQAGARVANFVIDFLRHQPSNSQT